MFSNNPSSTQPSSGGLFGSAPSAQQTKTGGLFGAPTSSSQPRASGGLFGTFSSSQQTQSTNTFGGNQIGFGTAPQQTSGGPGLFGARPASSTPFGSSSPFGSTPSNPTAQPTGRWIQGIFGNEKFVKDPATTPTTGNEALIQAQIKAIEAESNVKIEILRLKHVAAENREEVLCRDKAVQIQRLGEVEREEVKERGRVEREIMREEVLGKGKKEDRGMKVEEEGYEGVGLGQA